MIYTTAISIIHIIYSLKLFYSSRKWPLLLAMMMQWHKKLRALFALCSCERVYIFSEESGAFSCTLSHEQILQNIVRTMSRYLN